MALQKKNNQMLYSILRALHLAQPMPATDIMRNTTDTWSLHRDRKGFIYIIQHISVEIVTEATAANRNLRMEWRNVKDEFLGKYLSGNHVASTTKIYTFSTYVGNTNETTNAVINPLLINRLRFGDYLKFALDNKESSDTMEVVIRGHWQKL